MTATTAQSAFFLSDLSSAASVALVECCTCFMVLAMINMVLPEGSPPAFARSCATFFAAISASFAVVVSALSFRSPAILFISAVSSIRRGAGAPRRAASARSIAVRVAPTTDAAQVRTAASSGSSSSAAARCGSTAPNATRTAAITASAIARPRKISSR